MNKKSKSIILTIILCVIIFMIVYVNSISFVTGPYVKNESDTMNIHNKMALKLNAEQSHFINSLVLDKKVYVSSIINNKGKQIVFYDDDLNVIKSIDPKEINEKDIRNYINDNYHLDDYELKLGIYDNKIVIDIQTNNKEIVLDFNNYNEIFIHSRGGYLDE